VLSRSAALGRASWASSRVAVAHRPCLGPMRNLLQAGLQLAQARQCARALGAPTSSGQRASLTHIKHRPGSARALPETLVRTTGRDALRSGGDRGSPSTQLGNVARSSARGDVGAPARSQLAAARRLSRPDARKSHDLARGSCLLRAPSATECEQVNASAPPAQALEGSCLTRKPRRPRLRRRFTIGVPSVCG
jgi:hypothetical protein